MLTSKASAGVHILFFLFLWKIYSIEDRSSGGKNSQKSEVELFKVTAKVNGKHFKRRAEFFEPKNVGR